MSFLVLETSHYTQDPQLKAFKSLQAYDQMVSGFIKTVQGRVINDNFIVYIGKVRHSQKMNDAFVYISALTKT